MLTEHQQTFMDNFIATQDFKQSMLAVPVNARQGVRRSLNNSNTPLYKKYNEYLQSNSMPPETSKLNMVQVILRTLERAEEENDNAMVLKCVQELNKMTKGNLAASITETKVENTFVGLIDLTKPRSEQLSEGNVIDITNK